MKTGDKVELEITGIAAGGDGVGRYEGMAVFVPHTCCGDRAEVLITHVKASCAFGRVASLLSASPHRRENFCPAQESCGGCNFAHMEYAEQLRIKKQIVCDAMERIGGFKNLSVEDTLPAPRPERYRNKMVFPLGRDKCGAPCGGFYAPGSHDLIPLSDCRQGNRSASLWLWETLAHLEETGSSIYSEKTHRGFARRLFVRLAEGTGEAMVVLTSTDRNLREPEKLVERLLAVPSEYTLKSIIVNIHKEPDNLLLGKENLVLYGRDYIVDTLGELTFHISPHSFYQINPPQTRILYETALSLAELTGTETVLDLYCGIGTISLFAAKQAGHVIGVEVVPQAIHNAKENARRNGIVNAEFLLGKAEEVAPVLSRSDRLPQVVILDPPRKGAEPEALSAIVSMAPEKIVYVSCNPATLARDIKILAADGYVPTRVIPADMFPNTSHVECCVLLSRK